MGAPAMVFKVVDTANEASDMERRSRAHHGAARVRRQLVLQGLPQMGLRWIGQHRGGRRINIERIPGARGKAPAQGAHIHPDRTFRCGFETGHALIWNKRRGREAIGGVVDAPRGLAPTRRNAPEALGKRGEHLMRTLKPSRDELVHNGGHLRCAAGSAHGSTRKLLLPLTKFGRGGKLLRERSRGRVPGGRAGDVTSLRPG